MMYAVVHERCGGCPQQHRFNICQQVSMTASPTNQHADARKRWKYTCSSCKSPEVMY